LTAIEWAMEALTSCYEAYMTNQHNVSATEKIKFTSRLVEAV